MTTLICDVNARTLYCDSKITIGDVYRPKVGVQKYYVRDVAGLGECILGMSGSLDAVNLALRYLSGEIPDRPVFDENSVQGFIIPRDEAQPSMVFFGDTLAPYPVSGDIYTLGSGFLIARVIADYTGDVREGMRFACLRDPGSGFPFYRIRWGTSGLVITEYDE